MIQSPELQSKIAQWRARADAGLMTAEEWAECFAALRQDRRGALAASAKPKRAAKAPSAPVDIGALKSSLKSLAMPAAAPKPVPVVASTPVAGPPKL